MKKSYNDKYLKIIFPIIILVVMVFVFYYIFRVIDTYISAPDSRSHVKGFKDAEKFLLNGQAEIKSLSIQFLSLITGILVFSITFSEKIINYNQTKNSIRLILVLGWTLLILAIISNGIGLVFNSLALASALMDVHKMEHGVEWSAEFYGPALYALKAIIMSGVFFVTGLICIVIAGAASIFKKEKSGSVSY